MLRTATHQDLVDARNVTYMDLFKQYEKLVERYEVLEICYNELKFVNLFVIYAYIDSITGQVIKISLWKSRTLSLCIPDWLRPILPYCPWLIPKRS